MSEIKLGDIVRDKITKCEGIVTIETSYLNSDVRYTIENENGERTFDAQRLKRLRASVLTWSHSPKESEKNFELGELTRDTITLFYGYATAKSRHFTGCDRYYLEHPTDPRLNQWLDADRLIPYEDSSVVPVLDSAKKRGGASNPEGRSNPAPR